MAENEKVMSRRDSHIERLRKKSPDKKFEDDEEIFGQISDDYDQYESQLSGYRENEKTLSEMFSADPRSAQFLADWYKGKDPAVALIQSFGPELKEALEDPEKQEAIAKAHKEYLERVSKSKSLQEEAENNLEASADEIDRLQKENGASDEEIDKVMKAYMAIGDNGVVWKFDYDLMQVLLKGIRYDADIASAGEEGEIAGRNAKIRESLRKSTQGDGTMPLNGKNGRPNSSKVKNKSMFDLANEAM